MTYQGYKNRSTWLTVLWFSNHSLELYKKTREFAKSKNIENLKNCTIYAGNLRKEDGYNASEIDWNEVIESIND